MPTRVAGPAGERVVLAELIAVAVQRSPALAIARADHQEALARDAAAGAIDEWRIIGHVNAQSAVLDRALAAAAVAHHTQEAVAEVGLERRLSTGGDVTVTTSTGQVRHVYSAPAARTASGVADIAAVGMTASARIAASQPLLRGAGAEVARADQTTARLAARALSEQADDEAVDLVRDLVIGYWELAYAVQQLAVDRDGATLAQRQVAITQDVVRAGLQPPSALKIAELQVALREEQILRDEMAIADQSLSVRRLAGLELVPTPLVPADPVEVPTAHWSEDEVVARTLAHGPSIARKNLEQRQAAVAARVAHDARLPRLDLSVSGQLDGFGPATGDAFGRLCEAQAYSAVATMSFEWDLGGAARAADSAARIHRTRLDAERAELEHRLTSSAVSAVRNLRLATQRIELSELAVQVAQDALQVELAAFQGGRSTNVLVFQRQDDVAQARLRTARARIDAIEATALVQYFTGGLPARYGVKVDAARRGS